MNGLIERANRAREIVGILASEGRGPRMSIPVRPDDEDMFLTDTITDLLAALVANQTALPATDAERDLMRATISERRRQDEQWGTPASRGYTDTYYLAVLLEEVGEVAKALVEGQRGVAGGELIHVAATAIAMAESLEAPTGAEPGGNP